MNLKSLTERYNMPGNLTNAKEKTKSIKEFLFNFNKQYKSSSVILHNYYFSCYREREMLVIEKISKHKSEEKKERELLKFDSDLSKGFHDYFKSLIMKEVSSQDIEDMKIAESAIKEIEEGEDSTISWREMKKKLEEIKD